MILKNYGMMVCEVCGLEIRRHAPQQRYCKDCSKIAKKGRDALARERAREARKIQSELPVIKISPRRKVPTIEEINARAREMGLTYGKYVAKFGGR